MNIVPASTGAARATGLVLPSMQGRLDGAALRVPVVRRVDHRLHRGRAPGRHRRRGQRGLRAAAASGPLAKVLDYTEDPIVSSDIVGSPASCTFDAGLTMVMPVGRRHHPGQGAGLVRQRVGLRQPARRPGRAAWAAARRRPERDSAAPASGHDP